jgi:formate dehydrogenase subunit delta
MNIERLVTMANQIGAFFNSQGTRDEAVTAIAGHLKRFWEPRMLSAIFKYVEGGDGELQENVAAAVRSLQKT